LLSRFISAAILAVEAVFLTAITNKLTIFYILIVAVCPVSSGFVENKDKRGCPVDKNQKK